MWNKPKTLQFSKYNEDVELQLIDSLLVKYSLLALFFQNLKIPAENSSFLEKERNEENVNISVNQASFQRWSSIARQSDAVLKYEFGPEGTRAYFLHTKVTRRDL